MTNTTAYKWSPWQAFKVLMATIYGDLLGFHFGREAILGNVNISQKRFNNDRVPISCLHAVEGHRHGPPVVFLHGSPGNALDWKWFLKKARDKYTVYAVDRPGFSPTGRDAPDLDEDLAAFEVMLKEIKAETDLPVTLVGHSLAAGIAARLAANHPELVKALVLVAGGLDPAYEETHFVQELVQHAPLSWLLTPSVKSSNEELMQYRAFLDKLQPDLSRITCPVVVLHNEKDRLTPYENTAFIEKHCTNAASVNIIPLTSGGHFLNRTRPKVILEALKRL